MAADVLIVKNVPREGPGALQPVLDKNWLSSEVITPSERFPDPADYGAMIVFGGPDSANDDAPSMHAEIDAVQRAIDKGVPFLGVCLGAQVLVKAAGGAVMKCDGQRDHKEAGFIDPSGHNYTVIKTTSGEKDPLLEWLPREFKTFQLHGETFRLSTDMTMIGMGSLCLAQAVRVGENAYGIQSHFELTPEMLDVWATEDPDLQSIGQEVLAVQFASIQHEYERTGQQLFTNFLKIARLTS